MAKRKRKKLFYGVKQKEKREHKALLCILF